MTIEEDHLFAVIGECVCGRVLLESAGSDVPAGCGWLVGDQAGRGQDRSGDRDDDCVCRRTARSRDRQVGRVPTTSRPRPRRFGTDQPHSLPQLLPQSRFTDSPLFGTRSSPEETSRVRFFIFRAYVCLRVPCLLYSSGLCLSIWDKLEVQGDEHFTLAQFKETLEVA